MPFFHILRDTRWGLIVLKVFYYFGSRLRQGISPFLQFNEVQCDLAPYHPVLYDKQRAIDECDSSQSKYEP